MTTKKLSIYAKSFNWSGFSCQKKFILSVRFLYDFCRTIDNIADRNIDLEIKKNRIQRI